MLRLWRDAEVPGAGVAQLRSIGIVGNSRHAVIEVTIGVESIDLADGVIGTDVERREARREDLRDRLGRGDRVRSLVPRPIVLERLHRLWRVEIALEGDTVRSNTGEGRTVFLARGAAQDAVLVVSLPGALSPAEAPDVRHAVASVIDGRFLPSVPGLVHRPTLDGLRWLQSGRVGHILVVEHQRAAFHSRRRIKGPLERTLIDRLRHE